MAVLAAMFAVLIWVGCRYTAWKQTAVTRLQAGSQIINTSRGPVEYAIWGEGPAVLLLHGALGGYDQGLLMAQGLGTTDFKFIAVSRPGYLRTPLAENRTPAAQAALFVALLDELGIEKTAVFAASGGGFYGLQFAREYPDRCWALILDSANTRRPPPPAEPTAPAAFRHLLTSDFAQWAFFSLARRFPQQFLPILEPHPEWRTRLLTDPAKLDLFWSLFATTQPPSLRLEGAVNDNEQLLALTSYPVPDRSPPTLVIHGTEDTVPITDAEYVIQLIPEAEYIPVAGGDHWHLITHQEELTPAIVDFLLANAPQPQGPAAEGENQ